MKAFLITWDRNEQIDPKKLQKGLGVVFNSRDCPSVQEIDTQSDEYMLLISSQPVSPEKIAEIMERRYNDKVRDEQVFEI
ncbi:MAG TPA: hypothetical protein VLA04_02240 [Verrucomicrobiae bacterium]|nr:hypothetical protein [Verrucomicrobiae bacterium]